MVTVVPIASPSKSITVSLPEKSAIVIGIEVVEVHPSILTLSKLAAGSTVTSKVSVVVQLVQSGSAFRAVTVYVTV